MGVHATVAEQHRSAVPLPQCVARLACLGGHRHQCVHHSVLHLSCLLENVRLLSVVLLPAPRPGFMVDNVITLLVACGLHPSPPPPPPYPLPAIQPCCSSLTFTILLQSYSLFSLYRRMYLQQGEGHLITLADVLSSDGSDSLADASARQHILDSATPLSERGTRVMSTAVLMPIQKARLNASLLSPSCTCVDADLRDLVLTLGSNCDLTYNLRLDWPALPRKASRLPPLNQHDRHDFLREEG